ncbi:hypothetical protein KRX57_06325 [Weeksellaceae bacterium TAE3-ERU29]|nr:hypothetical protein [Weeksellaceae bacterium TAE3-ERU29]
MSALLKWVLFIIIIYYIYNWFISPSKKYKQQNTATRDDKEVKVFKTKEIEKPKYEIEAETVEYEEVKENETENK